MICWHTRVIFYRKESRKVGEALPLKISHRVVVFTLGLGMAYCPSHGGGGGEHRLF